MIIWVCIEYLHIEWVYEPIVSRVGSQICLQVAKQRGQHDQLQDSYCLSIAESKPGVQGRISLLYTINQTMCDRME